MSIQRKNLVVVENFGKRSNMTGRKEGGEDKEGINADLIEGLNK